MKTDSNKSIRMAEARASRTARRKGDSRAAHGSRIVWNGDLTDDCWAKVGNLLAHCECMGEIIVHNPEESPTKEKSEIWFVSVGPVNRKHFSTGDDIFHSGEPGGMIIGGTMARAIAEAILKSSNDQAH